MYFETVEKAEKELHNLYTRAKQGPDGYALKRMWPLLQRIGNPHEHLRVIHIAGTSGKTSTAYYIAALLRSTKSSVGLTVSPHVDSITERIQLNCANITDELFCQLMGEFLDMVYELDEIPSYFEVMTAFALWVFERQGMDYAVVETGLGGLKDCTNVVTREDKVCVITDIGKDHVDILGSDITGIAAQKAGIIHERNHVFMYGQGEAVMSAINSRVTEKHAVLHIYDDTQIDTTFKDGSGYIPLFQKRNWQLAQNVWYFICQRDGLSHSLRVDPRQVVVPGRMEIIEQADNSLLILDGAHNGQKVSTFVDSFKERFPGKKASILLALKKGKDYDEVLQALKPIVQNMIITSFEDKQDFPISSEDPAALYEFAKSLHLDSQVEHNTQKALQLLLNIDNDIKLVIGSIYLLGNIRHKI